MFSHCPHCHLVEATECKHSSWQTLSHDCECQPCPKFIGVIGAGDGIEEQRERVAVGVGNFPLLSAWWSKVPQGQVDAEVAQLTHNKSSQGGVHLQVTWGCEEGMVDMVGHISCESPVVSTVLEEVENWHGAMREPMNKQGLKDSFCVVEGPAPCSDVCAHGHWFQNCLVTIEEPRSLVQPQVYGQRTCIFS